MKYTPQLLPRKDKAGNVHHAKRFNKVHVFKDRKKSLKAGYSKHKQECERC